MRRASTWVPMIRELRARGLVSGQIADRLNIERGTLPSVAWNQTQAAELAATGAPVAQADHTPPGS